MESPRDEGGAVGRDLGRLRFELFAKPILDQVRKLT
jgi:hypothetical protein